MFLVQLHFICCCVQSKKKKRMLTIAILTMILMTMRKLLWFVCLVHLNAVDGRVEVFYGGAHLLRSLHCRSIRKGKKTKEKKTTVHGCVHCTYCCFFSMLIFFFLLFFLWGEKECDSRYIFERCIVFIFIRFLLLAIELLQ